MKKRTKIKLRAIIAISAIWAMSYSLSLFGEEENLLDWLEQHYEKNVLEKRCYLNQIHREKSNKPIDENFCTKEDNLEEFRLANIQHETIWQPAPENPALNIDNLAFAIAMAETKNCELWYWKMYNNCFWIKNWNTAPCKKIWKNKMCIYNTPEESYEAFKKIWSKWYRIYPNRTLASRWTGWDNPTTWLTNVSHYYK